MKQYKITYSDGTTKIVDSNTFVKLNDAGTEIGYDESKQILKSAPKSKWITIRATGERYNQPWKLEIITSGMSGHSTQELKAFISDLQNAIRYVEQVNNKNYIWGEEF